MNQEKLAKLGAEVRIGGKVCLLSLYFSFSFLYAIMLKIGDENYALKNRWKQQLVKIVYRPKVFFFFPAIGHLELVNTC